MRLQSSTIKVPFQWTMAAIFVPTQQYRSGIILEWESFAELFMYLK